MNKSRLKKTSRIKQAIFKTGFDTKIRNLDVIAVLKSLSAEDELTLDAGCGESGLSGHIKMLNLVGTDITIFKERMHDPLFVCSSISSLPFSDNFFPVTLTIDVLEHLPVEIREKGVTELIRTARGAVIMAFPAGQAARKVDEKFQSELIARKTPVPAWVEEHLSHSYPSSENMILVAKTTAEKYNKKIKSIKLYYSESIKITQLLRWTASRSKFLYIAANSLLGLLLPILPKPGETNSYRTIIAIEFEQI